MLNKLIFPGVLDKISCICIIHKSIALFDNNIWSGYLNHEIGAFGDKTCIYNQNVLICMTILDLNSFGCHQIIFDPFGWSNLEFLGMYIKMMLAERIMLLNSQSQTELANHFISIFAYKRNHILRDPLGVLSDLVRKKQQSRSIFTIDLL